MRTWVPYKSPACVRRGRRSWPTPDLKPYWGKPAVRNFRGGRGNRMHGPVAICHAAPKGGHAGSHWPKHYCASSLLDVQFSSGLALPAATSLETVLAEYILSGPNLPGTRLGVVAGHGTAAG